MSSPPDHRNLLGTTLSERYELAKLLATGSMGSVYEAYDTQGRRYAVKVFSHDVATTFPEYTEHLTHVHKVLGGQHFPGLLLPIDVGRTDQFSFEVYDFIPNAQTLEALINENEPLELKESLRLVAKLARALHTLHSHSIVHADVKPTNVLIRGDRSLDEAEIFLTDFGMALTAGTEDTVLVVGTYSYMHPLLRGAFKSKPHSTAIRMAPHVSRVGPFIDIYALGVIAIQLFTGMRRGSDIHSHVEIIADLSRNKQIADLPHAIKTRLANWVSAMLLVKPSQPVTAEWVAEEADIIAATVVPSSHGHDELRTVTARPEGDEHITNRSEAEVVLDELRLVSRSLTELSALFVSRGHELMAAPGFGEDEKLLSEVSAAFSLALKRTKNVWMITVAMTVCSFALIVSMIVIAVGMALYTGERHWSLIFGGATVPLILGTLLWKPFDRMFRATILTQQLEMIHVQTMAAFSATRDYNERVAICRRAFEQLTIVFDKHSSRDGSSQRKPGKRLQKSEKGGSL